MTVLRFQRTDDQITPLADLLRQLERINLAVEPVTRNTGTVSALERYVRDALLELAITSYYELCGFRLSNGRIYKPDFITDVTVDGRTVILEPHDVFLLEGKGSFRADVDKFSTFRRDHGDSFYFVCISKMLPETLPLRFGTSTVGIFDEHWPLRTKNHGGKKHSNKGVTEQVRERLKELRKFGA